VAARSDIHVIMVGTGPLEPEVRRRIAGGPLKDRATLVPRQPREQLAGQYAMADMLVLTSQVEGMPLVVLEALAMGCPVAATDVGDVAHVVTPGRNGFLVDAGQPLAMVQPLIDAITTGRYAGSRAAIRRDFCASAHNEAAMLAAYAQVLETL
jgi:glycosyltransferase involved in cell wall biosynthesis